MKIQLIKNAASYYRSINLRSYCAFSDDYYKALQQLKAKELEVDTQYLFADQFNTAPLEGLNILGMSEGLRIMGNLVERVIDDERIGLCKSHWDGAQFKPGEEIPDFYLTSAMRPFLFRFEKYSHPILEQRGVFLREVSY